VSGHWALGISHLVLVDWDFFIKSLRINSNLILQFKNFSLEFVWILPKSDAPMTHLVFEAGVKASAFYFSDWSLGISHLVFVNWDFFIKSLRINSNLRFHNLKILF